MESLDQLLTALSLTTVKACYTEIAELASREGVGYAEFLHDVLLREYDARETERIARRLRESRLPLEKSFATYDRARLSRRVQEQLIQLERGDFIHRRENVLVFGSPGSGKTHALCAIGQALIRQGARVYFRPCALIIQELLQAKQQLALPKFFQRLGRYDALILDDLGYVKYTREEMEVFFTLLADRYEQASILISSNQAFSQWESIFHDPLTAAAAIDRLIHHCVIVEMNVPSYRIECAQARRQREEGSQESSAAISPREQRSQVAPPDAGQGGD